MANFKEILQKIHQKPGMYLGAPSISALQMFLGGYLFARQEQNLALTPEEQEFEQFQGWVQQRFQVRATVSWAKVILLHAADERSGFELFFELWTEFLQRNQQPEETSRQLEPELETRQIAC